MFLQIKIFCANYTKMVLISEPHRFSDYKSIKNAQLFEALFVCAELDKQITRNELTVLLLFVFRIHTAVHCLCWQ